MVGKVHLQRHHPLRERHPRPGGRRAAERRQARPAERRQARPAAATEPQGLLAPLTGLARSSAARFPGCPPRSKSGASSTRPSCPPRDVLPSQFLCSGSEGYLAGLAGFHPGDPRHRLGHHDRALGLPGPLEPQQGRQRVDHQAGHGGGGGLHPQLPGPGAGNDRRDNRAGSGLPGWPGGDGAHGAGAHGSVAEGIQGGAQARPPGDPAEGGRDHPQHAPHPDEPRHEGVLGVGL